MFLNWVNLIIVKQEHMFYNGFKRRCFLVKEQLIKAMKRNRIIDIMYMAKDRKITKRRIKLIKISGDYAQAYCFTRHAKRNFIIDNILAVRTVNRKANGLEA